jgi:2-polyprenyl-6-methoxyphenol hydroxylase and related FAD-dependent oxidoreductases
VTTRLPRPTVPDPLVHAHRRAVFDVVVCGAGAGGLTLGLALGRAGMNVLILEKDPVPRELYKGELLQPRTLEHLRDLGVIGPLLAAGAVRVDRLACRTPTGDELVSVDYRMLPAPYHYGLVHYYRAMNEIIAAELPPNVTLQRGVVARELMRDPHGRVVGVVATSKGSPSQIRTRLVVAADGRASILRRNAGIAARATRYSHQLVSLDVRDVPGLGNEMAMYLTPDGVRVLFQMPGDRARMYCQIPTGSFGSIGARGLAGWLQKVLREVPALEIVGESLGSGRFDFQLTPAWRLSVAQWFRPGIALLGDAAHGVHPLAGQGMNGAILDACTLATELGAAKTLDEDEVDNALLRYQSLRRPAMAYVSRLSRNLATLFTSTSCGVRALRHLMLGRNRDNRRLQFRLTRNVAGLAAEPFTGWDWLCASGFVRDPRAQELPLVALSRSLDR